MAFSGPIHVFIPNKANDLANFSAEELDFELSYLPVVTDNVCFYHRDTVTSCSLRIERNMASLRDSCGRQVNLTRGGATKSSWAKVIREVWIEFCMETAHSCWPQTAST